MEDKRQAVDGAYVVKKNSKVNVFAFVGCLLLAFIIWIYVMNVKINDNTKTFTVKMDIKGESVLLNDRNYSIFGASETWVKVTVQGTNAELQKYSEKDFNVYIDVSNVESTGVTPLNIVVETPSTSISVVSTDPVQTTIFVDENINSKGIKLFVEAKEETMPSDAVVVLGSNIVNVSGPKTYVESIAYAKIYVESVVVDGNPNLTKTVYEIRFYDVSDKEIESPYLNFDPSGISVEVQSSGLSTDFVQGTNE